MTRLYREQWIFWIGDQRLLYLSLVGSGLHIQRDVLGLRSIV